MRTNWADFLSTNVLHLNTKKIKMRNTTKDQFFHGSLSRAVQSTQIHFVEHEQKDTRSSSLHQ